MTNEYQFLSCGGLKLTAWQCQLRSISIRRVTWPVSRLNDRYLKFLTFINLFTLQLLRCESASSNRLTPSNTTLNIKDHHHHHHPRISSRRKSWNKTSGPLMFSEVGNRCDHPLSTNDVFCKLCQKELCKSIKNWQSYGYCGTLLDSQRRSYKVKSPLP